MIFVPLLEIEITMSAELHTTRQELIDWINSLDDSRLLNLLSSIKLSNTDTDKDWWDELTPSQKENIELGLKDLEEDRTISSKEFWNRLRHG
jgi:hypothetical protein